MVLKQIPESGPEISLIGQKSDLEPFQRGGELATYESQPAGHLRSREALTFSCGSQG